MMNLYFFLGAFLFTWISKLEAQNVNQNYRFCIAEESLSTCEATVNKYIPQQIQCVPGIDKIDCIKKITRNEVDFVALGPEEVYVAHRFSRNSFSVISEIRSTKYKDRDFRYEPVAVVRKSSGIKSIADLSMKKSCHTGFGRNAGWKIPFSHLMDKGQLSKNCESFNAPTPEKDLNAVSKYFYSACAPGLWVPEKNKDKELKKKYPNLCELCNDPATCDKQDKFGGYEGTLDCLTKKSADISWTKMDAVKTYFKLNESEPLSIASEYEFLCWDGSSMPLTSENPCSWAKRPWSVYLGTSRLSAGDITNIQQQITILHQRGIDDYPNQTWISSIMELSYDSETKTFDVPIHNNGHMARQLRPITYLDRGKNYSVTIAKPSCATDATIRFCVKNEIEKIKCESLSLAAIGRRIFPHIECVLAKNTFDCVDKVSRDQADLVILEPKDADRAQREWGLVPVVSEIEASIKSGEEGPIRYALAVIKSTDVDKIRSLSDLKDKRSCHGSISGLQGWNIPLLKLKEKGLLKEPNCSLSIEITKFFSGLCVPGAKDIAKEMDWINATALCALCAGDGPRPGQAYSPETVCSQSSSERYYGDTGALRCLSDNVADVAFVDHVGFLFTALKDTSFPMNTSDLRLLCSSGGSASVDDYENCHWGKIPSRSILTNGGTKFLIKKEDVRLTLLKISDSFKPAAKSAAIMRLFGPFFRNKDLLFKDTSMGLCDYRPASLGDKNIIWDIDYCTSLTRSKLSNAFTGTIYNILQGLLGISF